MYFTAATTSASALSRTSCKSAVTKVLRQHGESRRWLSAGKGWSNASQNKNASSPFLPPVYSRQRHNSGNQIGLYIVGGISVFAGVGSAIVMSYCDEAPPAAAAPTSKSFEPLRVESFPLQTHSHGKTRVRVMKVLKDEEDPSKHSILEFNVTTTLHAEAEYEKCYTNGDNTNLVATDTQKNSVYLIAKRTKFDSAEGFGALLCHHFLKEYPMLDAVEADIDQVVWDRASIDGEPHAHAFVKTAPETFNAKVSWKRTDPGPKITSSVSKMTVLKTTQSGFEGYLQDKYTLLPETQERCMATELDASWTCTDGVYDIDYNATRQRVRELIQKGLFGSSKEGVYSPSLQATIYDAACLVLSELPFIESITIYTPNLHYLPAKLLDRLGESFDDDVFIPTNEPSGTITCTVVRNNNDQSTDEQASKEAAVADPKDA